MYYFFKFFSDTTNFGGGPGYHSWYTYTSFRKLFRRENWIPFYIRLRMYNGLARTSKQARVLIKCVASRSSTRVMIRTRPKITESILRWNDNEIPKKTWNDDDSPPKITKALKREIFLFYFCQNISSSLKKSADFWKSFTLRWFFKISTRISFS